MTVRRNTSGLLAWWCPLASSPIFWYTQTYLRITHLSFLLSVDHYHHIQLTTSTACTISSWWLLPSCLWMPCLPLTELISFYLAEEGWESSLYTLWSSTFCYTVTADEGRWYLPILLSLPLSFPLHISLSGRLAGQRVSRCKDTAVAAGYATACASTWSHYVRSVSYLASVVRKRQPAKHCLNEQLSPVSNEKDSHY